MAGCLRFCWRCGESLPAAPPTTGTACGQVHFLNPACGEAVVEPNDPKAGPHPDPEEAVGFGWFARTW